MSSPIKSSTKCDSCSVWKLALWPLNFHITLICLSTRPIIMLPASRRLIGNRRSLNWFSSGEYLWSSPISLFVHILPHGHLIVDRVISSNLRCVAFRHFSHAIQSRNLLWTVKHLSNFNFRLGLLAWIWIIFLYWFSWSVTTRECDRRRSEATVA